MNNETNAVDVLAILDDAASRLYHPSPTAYTPGIIAARAAVAEAITVLERWVGDGALQTFEDRQRFRAEASSALSRCGAKP